MRKNIGTTQHTHEHSLGKTDTQSMPNAPPDPEGFKNAYGHARMTDRAEGLPNALREALQVNFWMGVVFKLLRFSCGA